MGIRADEKARARDRIVEAASVLIRDRGIAGLKVNDVMAAAGLTHGAFYAHFENKDALVEAAFHAALDHREGWFRSAEKQPRDRRAAHLCATYLTERHRDHPGEGCAFASLAREFAQSGGPFPEIFEQELNVSLSRLATLMSDDTNALHDRQTAIGLLSLCVGGMVLARAVADQDLADELLNAAAAYGASETRQVGHTPDTDNPKEKDPS